MKKMKNQKGFTLMEMLIVVAIIAVLIVIAIPTFNNALAKSRAATDLANIRSGYASAQVAAMTEGVTAGGDVYVLQKDGNAVKQADSKNAYECQGASEKVGDQSALIGGTTAVSSVKWVKGSTINYEVTEGSDGVIEVEIKLGSGGTAGTGDAGTGN